MADKTDKNPRTDNPLEYEEGRRARLSGTDKKDAPYEAKSDKLASWQAGHDDAEGEAARDETMVLDKPAKGGGEFSALKDAKK